MYLFCNTIYCITFTFMKRVILTFETDPEFKKHLEKQALKNEKTLSAYIRAALKRQSKYKERELV